MTYLSLVPGLVLLVVGAELLVRGAVRLAEIGRISPLVIGLTVVAFGTSAPELAVSSVSSLKGDSAIALGNVIGSNIFNVLLILGLSALIVPLSVSSQLVRLDVPLMIAASVGTWLAALDGVLQRWEGLAMLGLFLAYTGWLIRCGRREGGPAAAGDEKPKRASWSTVVFSLILVAAGLGLLVLGAGMLVDSATIIARQLGVSDMVIGLTIVAAGTSLPELATSVVAAIRGQRDIAVGNVVGSNVFNLLTVLSAASLLAPAGVPVSSSVLWFDVVVMVFVAVLCWPTFLSYWTVSRTEGGIMLTLYVLYSALLVGEAMTVGNIRLMKNLFCFGMLPAVLLIVSVSAWNSVRKHESGRETSDT